MAPMQEARQAAARTAAIEPAGGRAAGLPDCTVEAGGQPQPGGGGERMERKMERVAAEDHVGPPSARLANNAEAMGGLGTMKGEPAQPALWQGLVPNGDALGRQGVRTGVVGNDQGFGTQLAARVEELAGIREGQLACIGMIAQPTAKGAAHIAWAGEVHQAERAR
jgi:hypothetical protein